MASQLDAIKRFDTVLDRLRRPDAGSREAEEACYAAREIWKLTYRRGVVVSGAPKDNLASRARKCLHEALTIVLRQKEHAQMRRDAATYKQLAHYAENLDFRLTLCDLLLKEGPAAVSAKIKEGIPGLVDKDVISSEED